MYCQQPGVYSSCRPLQETSINLLSSKFNFAKSDRVLDIGCGTGNFTSAIAKQVTSVVGIDVSKDMIEYARTQYRLTNVEYLTCDAQDFGTNLLKWKEIPFNKVVSMNSLHWIKDKKKVIQNIHQCLQPEGELFIAVIGPMWKVGGTTDEDLPYYLKNHPSWKHMLKNYEHGVQNEWDIADWSNVLETEGFMLVYKDISYRSEDYIFPNDNALKTYIYTMCGHLSCIPDERHDEFVQDAIDWCKRELPLNSDGLIYDLSESYLIQAKKH